MPREKRRPEDPAGPDEPALKRANVCEAVSCIACSEAVTPENAVACTKCNQEQLDVECAFRLGGHNCMFCRAPPPWRKFSASLAAILDAMLKMDACTVCGFWIIRGAAHEHLRAGPGRERCTPVTAKETFNALKETAANVARDLDAQGRAEDARILRTGAEGTLARFLDATVEAGRKNMRQSLYATQMSEFVSRNEFDRAAEMFLEDPDHWSTGAGIKLVTYMLLAMGRTHMGSPTMARFAREASRLCTSFFGTRDARVCTSDICAIYILRRSGELEEAEEMARGFLRSRRVVHQMKKDLLAETLNARADCLSEMGRHVEAIEASTLAMKAAQEAFSDRPRLTQSIFVVSRDSVRRLARAGHHAEAISRGEACVEFHMEHAGPDSWMTFFAQDALMGALSHGGRKEEAVEIARRLASTCRDKMSPERARFIMKKVANVMTARAAELANQGPEGLAAGIRLSNETLFLCADDFDSGPEMRSVHKQLVDNLATMLRRSGRKAEAANMLECAKNKK